MVNRIATAAVVAMLSLMVVGVDRSAAQEDPQGPPPNLHPGAYHRVVLEMWRDSPTFRQQCLTLATAPKLTVRIRGESTPSPTGVRARSEISVNPGGVSLADILLMSPADTVELIGHEIEHVVEMLEGVRLRDHGCRGNSMGHARESCNAVEAGRRVAAEVHAAKQQRRETGR